MPEPDRHVHLDGKGRVQSADFQGWGLCGRGWCVRRRKGREHQFLLHECAICICMVAESAISTAYTVGRLVSPILIMSTLYIVGLKLIFRMICIAHARTWAYVVYILHCINLHEPVLSKTKKRNAIYPQYQNLLVLTMQLVTGVTGVHPFRVGTMFRQRQRPRRIVKRGESGTNQAQATVQKVK